MPHIFTISYVNRWHTKRPVDRQRTLGTQNQSIVESKCLEDKKLLQAILLSDKNDPNMNVERIPIWVVIFLFMLKSTELLSSNRRK